MQKTLKDLTPEIEAKIPQYLQQGVEGIYNGDRYNNFNLEDAIKCVEWNYKQIGKEKPIVIVAENPLEANLMISILKKEKPKTNYLYYLFTMNVYSNCYKQWYSFIKQEFDLPLTESVEKDFNECFNLYEKSNIYCAAFFESLCVVVKYPKKIHKDTQNNLHCTTGSAVEWGATSTKSQWNCYYIHGRNVPEKEFLMAQNNEITKEIWLSQKNEDIKAAWFEILGAEKVMQILEARLINSSTWSHANGEIEELSLFKTDFVLEEIDEKLAWVKFVCPSTGTNYLISVDPKFDAAIDAVLDTCPFYGQEIKSSSDYKFTARG